MLSCFIASLTCRTSQNNDLSNYLYIFVIFVTNINNTLCPKRTCCRYSNIIIPRKAKAGTKPETEVITISTNFSFVSYDTDEGILNVSFLDLDFWLEYLTFLRILRYILCLIILNIAAVTNNCF